MLNLTFSGMLRFLRINGGLTTQFVSLSDFRHIITTFTLNLVIFLEDNIALQQRKQKAMLRSTLNQTWEEQTKVWMTQANYLIFELVTLYF